LFSFSSPFPLFLFPLLFREWGRRFLFFPLSFCLFLPLLEGEECSFSFFSLPSPPLFSSLSLEYEETGGQGTLQSGPFPFSYLVFYPPSPPRRLPPPLHLFAFRFRKGGFEGKLQKAQVNVNSRLSPLFPSAFLCFRFLSFFLVSLFFLLHLRKSALLFFPPFLPFQLFFFSLFPPFFPFLVLPTPKEWNTQNGTARHLAEGSAVVFLAFLSPRVFSSPPFFPFPFLFADEIAFDGLSASSLGQLGRPELPPLLPRLSSPFPPSFPPLLLPKKRRRPKLIDKLDGGESRCLTSLPIYLVLSPCFMTFSFLSPPPPFSSFSHGRISGRDSGGIRQNTMEKALGPFLEPLPRLVVLFPPFFSLPFSFSFVTAKTY